jgi:hypothetical protein
MLDECTAIVRAAKHNASNGSGQFGRHIPQRPKQFAEKLDLRCSAPKGAFQFKGLAVSLKRYPDTNLSFSANCLAVAENKPDIAAVNRCATQKQPPRRNFSVSSEAVPFQNKIKLTYPRQTAFGSTSSLLGGRSS